MEKDMEKDIENLIEELTKVRSEMLNEQALKLFNTIMEVLDERDKLREEKNLKKQLEDDLTTVYLNGVYDERDRWKSKIKEKIEELKLKYELADEYMQYDFDVDMNTTQVLQELMEDK